MNDQSTVKLVIAILGAIAVLVVGGSLALAFDDKSIPEVMVTMGGAALGAVAGILARTGTDPQQVVGPAGGPVDVEVVR